MAATAETIKKVEKIIEDYSKTGHLEDRCAENELSSVSFFAAVREYPNLQASYAQAKENRADIIADEVDKIADNEPNPHKARIRIDARKWKASVFKPNQYGEKLNLQIEGKVDIMAAINEGRKRVLNGRAEVIDTPYELLEGSTDKETVAPEDPFDC